MNGTVAIITPCFNEGSTVIKFLRQLEETLADLSYHFTVVVVNDSSTDNTLELLSAFEFIADNVELNIITLRFNVGHQGAIYQGLLYGRELEAEKFIVMDSDGEDDPTAITEILEETQVDIVHVVRGKRNEGWLFRISYYFYKLFFRLITNKNMNFGNYCMITRKVLNVVVHTSFIHFAAYLSKIKVTHAYITHDRRKRIGGHSKMNISSLVSHAFKSLTEYAESLLLMFLKLFIIIATTFLGLIVYILYQKIFTDNAILGWASTMSVGLFSNALVAIGFYVIGILLLNIAHGRTHSSRTPLYERVLPSKEKRYLESQKA